MDSRVVRILVCISSELYYKKELSSATSILSSSQAVLFGSKARTYLFLEQLKMMT